MLKITTISIIVMFLASALILPVGMSYAVSYGGTMNGTAPMTSGMTNSTMPMTHGTMNGTMPMTSGMTNSTVPMTHGMTNSTMPMTNVAAPKTMAPLEQVKSGVAPKDVQCKSGLSLILKAEDGSAACVDSTVAQVLVTRGWAAHS
jgi:hypothetical protein